MYPKLFSKIRNGNQSNLIGKGELDKPEYITYF